MLLSQLHQTHLELHYRLNLYRKIESSFSLTSGNLLRIYWSVHITHILFLVSISASIFWSLIDTSFMHFLRVLCIISMAPAVFGCSTHFDTRCPCSLHLKHFGPCVFVGQSLLIWLGRLKHFLFFCSLFPPSLSLCLFSSLFPPSLSLSFFVTGIFLTALRPFLLVPKPSRFILQRAIRDIVNDIFNKLFFHNWHTIFQDNLLVHIITNWFIFFPLAFLEFVSV